METQNNLVANFNDFFSLNLFKGAEVQFRRCDNFLCIIYSAHKVSKTSSVINSKSVLIYQRLRTD